MLRKRLICLLAVAACLVGLAVPGVAAEVDSDSVYCFTSGDFSYLAEPLTGICITELPDPQTGTVMLGNRVVRTGDIFTAEQLEQMTFLPVQTEEDTVAAVSYFPIYEDRVEQSTVMTISIRGKKDKAPEAKDMTLETYKNIPNEGTLKASDPEGKQLTYTVTRQPRRGEVTVNADGTFVYTPKKNKVGVDSFTYTATDPAGNVSREATVTIQILKPADAAQYQDTVGLECRFEAEWLRNTGLFTGEKVGGEECFRPDKTVSKGEFLAMLVELLEVPAKGQSEYTGLAADAPDWLKPYLAAAARSGMLTGMPDSFDPEEAVTGAEAALILQNVLDLAVTETMADGEEPTQTELALTVMNENGFALEAEHALTRAEVANILYQVSITDAPGKTVFKLQQQ